MFDPILLRSFIAVVDEEGFSRAAEKLHLTQSAVSGHLRRLEDQIGKPLLQRTTRSQKLTEDGRRLATHARTILALTYQAWSDMTRLPFQGRFRVGLAEDVVDVRLLRALQDFSQAYPGLILDVQVNIPGTLLAMMDRAEVDLVVGSVCETQESGTLLWSEPMVWACAESYPQPTLGSIPLALFPEPCPYRRAALLTLAQAGIPHRMAMLCNSMHALRSAVLAGFAIAPVPISQLGAGLAALGPERGLPALPEAGFRLFVSSEADQVIAPAITQAIIGYSASRRE